MPKNKYKNKDVNNTWEEAVFIYFIARTDNFNGNVICVYIQTVVRFSH